MSLINRLLKANPSAQVSDMLTGYFVIPSAKSAFIPPLGNIGVFGGGNSATNVIDYINIASTGNAIDFGDLTQSRYNIAGGGSATRGVFSMGYTPTAVNTIDYISLLSKGNAIDFGDRSTTDASGNATSNGIIMVMVSGPNYTADYITIATTGNSTAWGGTWGASSSSGDENVCSAGSSTRGLYAAGYRNVGYGGTGGPKSFIGDITFATTGVFNTFGNLIKAGYSGKGGASNGTRAVFKADFSDDDLEYVTIASRGNGTYFGEADANTNYVMNAGDCSNGTRGIFTGQNGLNNVISYITIATTGNALDFGDLTVARNAVGSTSTSHGGLQ